MTERDAYKSKPFLGITQKLDILNVTVTKYYMYAKTYVFFDYRKSLIGSKMQSEKLLYFKV